MPEISLAIDATLDPIVEKALKIAKENPGIRWMAGLRASYQHDVQRQSNSKLAVAVSPGQMIPVSVNFSQDWQRTVQDTTNLQVYFLFSSADAPSTDPAPGSFPAQPTLPGTTDGPPAGPLNAGGDPAQG